MAATKVTFTLDPATVARIEDAAARLSLPKSQIVREAVHEFHDRIGRLSDSERLRLLRAFDQLAPRVPARSAQEADRELAALRRDRRTGGRRSLAGRGKA